jgi:hypothetical protein
MGLDLYVGSLTRYFCGNWETIIQQHAREKGLGYLRVQLNDNPKPLPSKEEAQQDVINWRISLNNGFLEHKLGPFDWDENPDAPYFTDQLHHLGHSSILLWAAYFEHKDLTRPEQCIDDFRKDPAYVRSSTIGAPSEFKQLLKDTVCWLPCDFPFAFEAIDLSGNDIGFGSSINLLEELNRLNNLTWKAERATITRWRRLGLGKSCTLEEAAQYGLSVFLPLTEKAVENKLVMRLDW